MIVQISQTTPNPPLQFDTDDLYVRGWYSNPFIGGDGVTPVEGGNGQTGFFYNTLCTRNLDGYLVIPARDRQATTDSNPTAVYFERLYVDGAPDRMIIDGWAIPTIYGSIVAFDQLARYNAAVFILNAPSTFFTAAQTIAEILRLAAAQVQNYAAVDVLGLAQASYAPLVASEPTFLSTSDPTRILGAIDASAIVPRSDGINSLVDSQITDDGTNVGVQTLNYFQAGDYNFVQNGSRVDVNDNLGRADIFAGGNGQAEYAGLSAVCEGSNPAQVFVQGTDYSYLYGQSGVLRLGDGLLVNNGTFITIDDVTRLIKLGNIPTSDPAVAGALWRNGNILMISNG